MTKHTDALHAYILHVSVMFVTWPAWHSVTFLMHSTAPNILLYCKMCKLWSNNALSESSGESGPNWQLLLAISWTDNVAPTVVRTATFASWTKRHRSNHKRVVATNHMTESCKSRLTVTPTRMLRNTHNVCNCNMRIFDLQIIICIWKLIWQCND